MENIKIILEGPKGSGKSTIANFFKRLGFEYVHSDSTTENDINYHLSLIEKRGNWVIDRYSLGEMIYSPIYDRPSKLSLDEFLETIPENDNIIIIVLYASNGMALADRITKRDKIDYRNIDLSALNKSNDFFEFLGKTLSQSRKNVLVYDTSLDNYKVTSDIIPDILKKLDMLNIKENDFGIFEL